MYVDALSHLPRFADRVAKMLERVEHRAALSSADREAAYRLRYEAYLRENLLNQRVIDGELASTVRVHVVADEEAVSPAHDVFPDVLAPHLRGHRVIIDPSRLAARADMARRFPELPYFAVRPGWLAAHHFHADCIVLSCVSAHQAYYRRVFRFQTWSDLRSYPKVAAKVVCMGLDFAAEMERVETRYPCFRSTPAEREALFGEFSLSLGPVAAAHGGVPAPSSVQANA